MDITQTLHVEPPLITAMPLLKLRSVFASLDSTDRPD
jgi:hypothetical protein